MSFDRHANIWHLTTAGWVFGVTGMYLSAAQEKENKPNNPLLTLKYEENQSSQYSKPACHMEITYVNPRQYADLVRAILTHGLYPNHDLQFSSPPKPGVNLSMAANYEEDTPLATVITKSPLFAKRQTARITPGQ